MPAELRFICNRWSAELIKRDDQNDQIEYVRNALPALLNNQALFMELLRNIAGGHPFPDIHKAQLFEDEILLYLNTKPVFSIRMFIYEPGIPGATPVLWSVFTASRFADCIFIDSIRRTTASIGCIPRA